MDSIQADDLILVAILPEPRDLEILRVLGWYRIPLERAPKSPHVDWLAFYLPGAFPEGRWSVRYAARVLGVELVRRKELLREEVDHPRAEDPYLKFQLGPLFELKHPVPARKWRRFTFLYTTGERLLQARDVRDLRISASDAGYRL
ncbi:MAG: hypothetical protein ACK2T2_11210 [Anaerolineales bacterium]